MEQPDGGLVNSTFSQMADPSDPATITVGDNVKLTHLTREEA